MCRPLYNRRLWFNHDNNTEKKSFTIVTAYVPRFCRLRGNLLFYFKNTDMCMEPVGVFVLERCVVTLDDTNTEPAFTFNLVYDGDKNVQKFSAPTETERDSWIQMIHMASYQYMVSQLKALREKLNNIQPANENSNNSLRFPRTKNVLDSSDESFLEMSLSCDNLMCDGNGTAPNPMLIVGVMTAPEIQWSTYSQSEIIERSSNPCFLTTVGFRKNDKITPQTRVKISVYDVRERLTLTTTLLGDSIFTIQQLMEAEKSKLRLPLTSSDNMTVGFVSVNAWQVESDSASSNASLLSNQSSCQEEVISERKLRSQTLPAKLPCKFRISQHNQLNLLYDNTISQTYRFHTGLGADLSVLEIMAENKLTFAFPQSLLLLYIKEEKDLLNNLTALGEFKSSWNARHVEEIERHLRLIDSYTHVLTFLDSYTGSNFKPSAQKCNKSFEFVPVNLHLQRLWIQNDSTKKSGFYDVITVGAFAAHTLKFKNGGLLKLLNPNSSKKNAKPIKLIEAAKTADKIRDLRFDLKLLLDHLNVLAQRKLSSEMQVVMTDIANLLCQQCLVDRVFTVYCVRAKMNQELEKPFTLFKAQRITGLCDSNLIEEAYHILEEVRLPENNNSSNANSSLVINKHAEEIISSSPDKFTRGRTSPLVISAQNSLEMDDDSLSTEDEKSDCNRDPSSCRGHHRRSASDADQHRCEIVKSTSASPTPSISRKFGWRQTKQASENGGSSTLPRGRAFSFAESNSMLNLFRKVSSRTRRERSMMDVGSTNSKIDSNRMEYGGFLNKNKTFSLRSLNGRKLRSRSPDEPEPWDLTQLNIEASIMCMTSKVITLGRHNIREESNNSPINGELTQLDWVEQLRPSMKKLKQALDCLHRTSTLVHSLFSLQEAAEVVALQSDIRYRRNIVNSYALTSVVASLMTKLWCHRPDPVFLSRLCKFGVLTQFEGLLSCYSDEMGMLEDMIIGIEDLKNVRFRLVKSENSNKINPQIEGTRTNLIIYLPVPDLVYTILPMDCKNNYEFVVSPVFFNVGINEQATFAEKKTSCMQNLANKNSHSPRFGNVSLQDKINLEGFAAMQEFYKNYKDFPVSVGSNKRLSDTNFLMIEKDLEILNTLVNSHKSKNVEILHLAAKICRSLDGLRFISCKSAKDRTAMSVTLEQCMILEDGFDLAEPEFNHALECMRCEGTRRENTFKNAGVMKYAFNSLQLMALPKMYRPPPGTYGNVQT
uniref:PH domain-containing protein n=1 Tax=Strigamia maritima TaxID=126957 RepID=T1IR47_STRMM